MANKLGIKKGDTVVVVTGEDKKKSGKVIETLPDKNRVLVEGVNMIKKHRKARSAKQQSAIVNQEAPVNASNVMLLCGSCKSATRAAIKETNGQKARVCKKCGADLDK